MKSVIISAVLILMLSACSKGINRYFNTKSPNGNLYDLPVLGQAPELENEVWLNVEQPLRIADLRGKVVLLDMWTFG